MLYINWWATNELSELTGGICYSGTRSLVRAWFLTLWLLVDWPMTKQIDRHTRDVGCLLAES
jgi:hypothetical protein